MVKLNVIQTFIRKTYSPAVEINKPIDFPCIDSYLITTIFPILSVLCVNILPENGKSIKKCTELYFKIQESLLLL